MPNIQLSGRMKPFSGGGIGFNYPDDWQVQQGQSGVTIVPANGVVQGEGSSAIGYGIMVSAVKPQGGRVDLRRDSEQLIRSLAQGNQNVKVDSQPQQITVGGSPSLVTRLSSDAPYKGQREVDVVITIDRGNALYYMVFIAPEKDWSRFEPMFQQVAQSVQFQ
jgi:hypothetical protein